MCDLFSVRIIYIHTLWVLCWAGPPVLWHHYQQLLLHFWIINDDTTQYQLGCNSAEQPIMGGHSACWSGAPLQFLWQSHISVIYITHLNMYTHMHARTHTHTLCISTYQCLVPLRALTSDSAHTCVCIYLPHCWHMLVTHITNMHTQHNEEQLNTVSCVTSNTLMWWVPASPTRNSV